MKFSRPENVRNYYEFLIIVCMTNLSFSQSIYGGDVERSVFLKGEFKLNFLADPNPHAATLLSLWSIPLATNRFQSFPRGR